MVLEVVQGEGGVHLGTAEFLQGAHELCREHGALLILDEVQTGFFGTGKPWMWQSIATRDPSAAPGPPGATGAGENPQFPATTLVTPCSKLIFIRSSCLASASVQSAWECMSMKPGDTMQPPASST